MLNPNANNVTSTPNTGGDARGAEATLVQTYFQNGSVDLAPLAPIRNSGGPIQRIDLLSGLADIDDLHLVGVELGDDVIKKTEDNPLRGSNRTRARPNQERTSEAVVHAEEELAGPGWWRWEVVTVAGGSLVVGGWISRKRLIKRITKVRNRLAS